MRCIVTVDTVNGLFDRWRGNGGRCSLYYLTQQYGLTVNQVYSILTTPREDAIRKARKKLPFHSLEE